MTTATRLVSTTNATRAVTTATRAVSNATRVVRTSNATRAVRTATRARLGTHAPEEEELWFGGGVVVRNAAEKQRS